jgi:phosphoribosylanthranilate isomerase
VIIKICGITRLEDAQAAAALGVHALGFVLWRRSPRAVTFAAVRAIVDDLPPVVTPVGVFVDPTAGEITAALAAGIQVAQVHGDVPVALPPGTRVIRAVHLAPDGGGIAPAVPGRSTILVDAEDAVKRGGTGRTIDWRRVAKVAADRPVILAGGLTPANVRDAVRAARPYGVDVSSGVERAPGVKDHDLMTAFVAAVRREAS